MKIISKKVIGLLMVLSLPVLLHQSCHDDLLQDIHDLQPSAEQDLIDSLRALDAIAFDTYVRQQDKLTGDKIINEPDRSNRGTVGIRVKSCHIDIKSMC